MKSTATRCAFTIIELLCVIAIVALLAGMSLPAIQSARESARNTSCRNNLRNLALGVHQFEATMKKLPPGSMSFEAIRTDNGVGTYYDHATNPGYQFYWKKTQNTSWLAYVLAYIDAPNVRDQFPQRTFSWTEHVNCAIDSPNVREAIRQHIEWAYCPSDNLRDEISAGMISAAIWSQPTVAISPSVNFQCGEPDGFSTEDSPVIPELTGKFGGTNYLGCCGVFSSESHPARHPAGYSGTLLCGRALPLSSIFDGTSNTVLIGESLGTIAEGIRSEAYTWAIGGVARGRGYTGWLETYNASHYFLSDSKYSYRNGFGSKHPIVVNVAFTDGSVHSTNRGISVKSWYSMCGRNDGTSIESVDF